MQTLTQQITQLQGLQRESLTIAVNRVISQGIIQLINRAPFYGLLMAQVDRQVSSRLTAAVGLSWQHGRITLLYCPTQFVRQVTTAQDLFFFLEHEALHLVWLHPVRYPRVDRWVQLGTDLAVNQFVLDRPSWVPTIERFNWQLHTRLPVRQDSARYILLLKREFRNQRGNDSADHSITKNGIRGSKTLKALFLGSDDHQGWQREPNLDAATKTARLKRLIRGTLRQTTAKGRGRLPGKVRQQLRRFTPQRSVNWRKYVRMGLGNLPLGEQPSRARFNRRQAYRMDLMGQVSNYVQNVDVFVDNSGSMSDFEIQFLLAQLGGFLRQFPVNVAVNGFDADVHPEACYVANHFRQLRFQRIGGGGTRFQSIFDYCHHHSTHFRQHLLLILTDGQGESHLNYYGMTHIVWLLTTPVHQFSVRNVRGSVVSLANDPALLQYLGRKTL